MPTPTLTLPELAENEIYAGICLNADGSPSHHLILLPGQADKITWPDALEWATAQGGTLPTRQEQALLFANAKGHFQPRWYWSSEQLAAHSNYAWHQHFLDGTQDYYGKSSKARARAVRRLPI